MKTRALAHERWLVTGGLGFMGSTFIRQLVHAGVEPLNIDLDTYAGDERRLQDVSGRFRCRRMSINDPDLPELVADERPEVIVHFAAETHVTRSETDPPLFFETNVEGTRRVLEAAQRAGVSLVVHVSTDEVYGPLQDRPFREEDKLPGEGRATSAYARSKALADDLARSFASRVPVTVVRPTNCFGPWQHPEKAIARWATRALLGQRLPVWGDGRYVRDWMYVEDACEAIRLVVERGRPGEVYNVAPEAPPLTNLQIAGAIALAAGRGEDAVYLTEYDRPRHDRRYAIDASKLRGLGWQASKPLESRLGETVNWYRENESWWASLIAESERMYTDGTERRISPQHPSSTL